MAKDPDRNDVGVGNENGQTIVKQKIDNNNCCLAPKKVCSFKVISK